jgi:hypothetical protein
LTGPDPSPSIRPRRAARGDARGAGKEVTLVAKKKATKKKK